MQETPSTATRGRPFIYLAFWMVVFLLNVGPEWYKYESAREVIEIAGLITLLQFLVASIALRYLVPRYLDRGLVKRFVLTLLGLLFIATEINILVNYFYFESAYPSSQGARYQALRDLNLFQRLGWSRTIKWIVFSKLPLFFFPAAVLIAASYYQKQRALLQLKEQRRSAELNALKSQLNPHFIFNTLNNIYSLALKKSDQTAEAIAKLAGILDYVLYRCRDHYVALSDEVDLLASYIDLEKLRFGQRLSVSFSNQVSRDTQIAPLLLLTLVENAFKHSASEELNRANIDMELTETGESIVFKVNNSKPKAPTKMMAAPDKQIGQANLRRQLDLLYPGNHQLEVSDTATNYTVSLTLRKVSQ